MIVIMTSRRPNIVFVFADQWRQCAASFNGDPNLRGRTPHMDALAAESVNFSLAVAGCPVCSPYRASLLTGLRPHRHGVFVNDLALNYAGPKLGEIFRAAGYDTAWIGKWHVDGPDRGAFIPRQRRCGFDFWEVLECTHDYTNSWYWGNDDRLHRWEGYDALAQARHAAAWLRARTQRDPPFFLVVSWGPPHNPYHAAPEHYRASFHAEEVELRPNVPRAWAECARRDLAGYYAHIAALDEGLGEIIRALEASGQADETIVVLTSDHGDMLGSQGLERKQKPWDESLRVPFLVRDVRDARRARVVDAPIDAQDLLPTLLGLAGLAAPEGIDGLDYTSAIREGRPVGDGAALIACYAPFDEWSRAKGGREYRGLRTARHTYVRTFDGPWLLYDNILDPYQIRNLVSLPEYQDLLTQLEAFLDRKLKEAGDDFSPAGELIAWWGHSRTHEFTPDGTVRYRNFRPPPTDTPQ